MTSSPPQPRRAADPPDRPGWEIKLRPVQEGDRELLLDLYASTRAEELKPVPWTAEEKKQFIAMQFSAQTTHYAQHYPGMSRDVVLVNGSPAGRLLVERWPQEIRIVDIALLPEFRGRSVGTHLLLRLQREAAESARILTIHVERFNPALRLYERLGFRMVEDKGVYLLMEWRSDRASTN